MPNKIEHIHLFNLAERLNDLDPASLVAIENLAEERIRQIEEEGCTPERDDGYAVGELSRAAACYALVPQDNRAPIVQLLFELWPWDVSYWKPKTPDRNRVRAGALIIADMARHFRIAAKQEPRDAD